MVKKVGQSEVFADGTEVEWPRPVHEGALIDSEGATWTMRGPALEGRRARRVIRTLGVRVVHAYGLDVVELDGVAKSELLARVEEYLRGEAPPHSVFELAEFRDGHRNVMFVAQESC
jgi:hypothetical protein